MGLTGRPPGGELVPERHAELSINLVGSGAPDSSWGLGGVGALAPRG